MPPPLSRIKSSQKVLWPPAASLIEHWQLEYSKMWRDKLGIFCCAAVLTLRGLSKKAVRIVSNRGRHCEEPSLSEYRRNPTKCFFKSPRRRPTPKACVTSNLKLYHPDAVLKTTSFKTNLLFAHSELKPHTKNRCCGNTTKALLV